MEPFCCGAARQGSILVEFLPLGTLPARWKARRDIFHYAASIALFTRHQLAFVSFRNDSLRISGTTQAPTGPATVRDACPRKASKQSSDMFDDSLLPPLGQTAVVSDVTPRMEGV